MTTDRPFPRCLLNLAPQARWHVWRREGFGIGYRHGPWTVHLAISGLAVVEYSQGPTSVRVRCHGVVTALTACHRALGMLTGGEE